MNRPLSCLLLLGALATAAPALAQVSDPNIIGTYKLSGSLEVITSEDHASPWAVIDTFVAAGSSSDFAGGGGTAAATAYAVWAGGAHAPLEAVAGLGGTSRILVERGVTHFQARVPASAVAQAIAAIGDVFSHPDWPGLDVERTQKALSASATDFNASAHDQALQLLMEASFEPDMAHPVFGRGPVKIDRGDVQAFFEHHYLPDRMKVVLTGDFETGKVVGDVVRGYANVLKRVPAITPIPARTDAAPGHGNYHPATPVVLLGAKGPELSAQREQAAMEMLVKVLAGSPAARIDKALAALGGAQVTGARWLRGVGPAFMEIQVRADQAAPDAVTKAVQGVLDDVRANPITLDEHAKAMNAALSDETVLLTTLDTRATALGMAAIATKSPDWVRTYPEELRQVSRQDVMAVAQKYLAPNEVHLLVVTP